MSKAKGRKVLKVIAVIVGVTALLLVVIIVENIAAAGR